ncbi:MAG: hypothetical protein M3O02_11475 [Acidobacteriota bacterium]|nr:hypothetical protein [Acidobacteriota bacterium]
MILGMSLPVFTVVHVAIGLVGICAGMIVVLGMFQSARLDTLTTVFLLATAATSLTGFLFPYRGVTAGIILSVLSLILLAAAALARYRFYLRGRWRWIYTVSAVVALYFNVFVLLVQTFQKIPAVKALAPTGKEPPFLVAQLVTVATFAALGVMTVRRFHPVMIVVK